MRLWRKRYGWALPRAAAWRYSGVVSAATQHLPWRRSRPRFRAIIGCSGFSNLTSLYGAFNHALPL